MTGTEALLIVENALNCHGSPCGFLVGSCAELPRNGPKKRTPARVRYMYKRSPQRPQSCRRWRSTSRGNHCLICWRISYAHRKGIICWIIKGTGNISSEYGTQGLVCPPSNASLNLAFASCLSRSASVGCRCLTFEPLELRKAQLVWSVSSPNLVQQLLGLLLVIAPTVIVSKTELEMTSN